MLFFQTLPESERSAILPELSEFQSLGNGPDWRVREVWAQQLVELVAVYDLADVAVHIQPHVLALMQDRVAQVRTAAIVAVSIYPSSGFPHIQSSLRLDVST